MPRGTHPKTLAALERHRPNGRPKLPANQKRVRVDIRLLPATVTALEGVGNRSEFIEAAVLEKLANSGGT